MRTISGEQIADAIGLNNYPQATGFFFESGEDVANVFHSVSDLRRDDEEKVVLYKACAIGQCALNLGVDPYDLQKLFSLHHIAVIEWNDTGSRTYQQIARAIKKYLRGVTFTFDEVNYNTIFSNYQGVKV